MTQYTRPYTNLYKVSSLSEKAYVRIRDLIDNGDLRAGERLVENQISEMIDVGRTPIREALRRLEAEGFVDVLANKGAVVKKISLKEMREIYDLIALLEGHATEIATENIKAADKAKLKAIQKHLKKSRKVKDYRTWMENNALFHSYFSERSGSGTLYKLISQLRTRAARYRFMAVIVPGSLGKYIRAHEEILGAVLKGESKKAGKLMREHVLDAKEKLIEFLEQSPELHFF